MTTNAKPWPMVPLGDIAEVKLGKMLDKTKHRSGQPLPYLRNINVRWGSVDTSDLLEMNFEDDELHRFGVKEGDVLVCEGGEPGRAAVWNDSIPNIKYQKAIHRVRFKQPYEPRILVYLLELLAKTGRLERRFTGSTIKHFTREAIVRLPVPVPPLDEQQRIVAEIEKQFTRLDAGVASMKRVEAALKRYRDSVLKAACEGRLVPTEAELARKENRSYESAEQLLQGILKERRENWKGKGKYKEPVAPNIVDLPILPEGWAWTSLAALARLENGDRSKNYPSRSAFVSSGVPFINAGHLQRGKIQFDEMNYISEQRYAALRAGKTVAGDILFCLRGSLGKVALVAGIDRGAIASSLVIVQPYFQELTRYIFAYLQSWFAHQMIAKYDNGSAQPNLAAADLAKFSVPFPPFHEQQRITAEIERRLSVVEELATGASSELQRAIRLRQAILVQAFRGQ
jgi:type I restriction enzyme S subunit